MEFPFRTKLRRYPVARDGGVGESCVRTGSELAGARLMRLLEMLVDRFGAFETIAYSSIKLARFAPPDELAMDPLVANAVLEFGDDLREVAAMASHTRAVS